MKRLDLASMLVLCISGLSFGSAVTPITVIGTPDSTGVLSYAKVSSTFNLFNNDGTGWADNYFPDGADCYFFEMDIPGSTATVARSNNAGAYTLMQGAQWSISYAQPNTPLPGTKDELTYITSVLFGTVANFNNTTKTANLLCSPTVYKWDGSTQTFPFGGYQGAGSGELNAQLSKWVYKMSWNTTSITLTPYTPLNGDASLDGNVDVSDLGILAANYGGSGKLWTQGDFNSDGGVDVSDLGILAANYGQSGGAVPEPMTMSLLAVGGLALLRRKS